MKGLGLFRNTRARVTRYSDAKIYSGWTIDVTPSQIIVRIGTSDLLPEDTLMVELNGPNAKLLVTCRFEVNFNGNCVFHIINEPKVLPTSEIARFAVSSFKATASYAGGEIGCRVMDVSETGMGLSSPHPFEKGSFVDLVIELPAGQVEVKGEVRYVSRPGLDGEYRIGILVSAEGRLAAARWKSLINDYLKAA